jgi:CBS domain-containing protein
MSRCRVREVMTTDVLPVFEGTPVGDVAAVLAATGLAAVPVLDPAGHVTGLAMATDLPPSRPNRGPGQDTGRQGPWRRRRSVPGGAGAVARDVMRSPLITTAPEAPLGEAARAMSRHQLSVLPVVDACGFLAGVLRWADLGQVFLRPDSDIQHEIVRDVFVRHLGTNPALVHASVTDGLVTLSGVVEKKTMIPLAVTMAGAVDGVVDVLSYLAYAADDTAQAEAQPSGSAPEE